MALEDLEGPDKYIDDLVSSNPEGIDDRAEGDNHMRGIKNTLKNSFPAVSGPVSATHQELSQLQGYDTGAGTVSDRLDDSDAHIADSNIHFGDVAGGGLYLRSAAGWVEAQQDIGDISAHIADTSIHFGDVTAQGTYGRSSAGWVPMSGAGTDSLNMTTGGMESSIPMDLKMYQDSGGGLHEFTNDVMSYNILGSTAGKTIGVRLGSNAIQNVAVVGTNGSAHGWLSAAGVASIMGWSGSAYTNNAAMQFYERGPDVPISPSKTLVVTKTTTSSAGTTVPEMVTAGLSGEVHLDLKVYRDSGGGLHNFTNDMMVFNIVGVEPGKTIGVQISGTIYDLCVAGTNGIATGWVSVLGILNSSGGLGSDAFTRVVPLQFYSRSPDVFIGPAVNARCAKTTTSSEGTQAETIYWQEQGLSGSRVLQVRYVNNFLVDSRTLVFTVQASTANASVYCRASNGQQVLVGYTNSTGFAVGQIAGSWLVAWGYGDGQTTTISVRVGGVTKASISCQLDRVDG